MLPRIIIPSFVFLAAGCSLIGGNQVTASPGDSYKQALLSEEVDRGIETDGVEDTSDAYYNFIVAQLKLRDGNLEDALEHLEEVGEYETAPSPTLRRQLAELYLKEGEIDDALSELETGLESARGDASYLQVYGGVLSGSGQYDRAIEVYREALSLKPRNSEYIQILIANVLEQKGDLSGAAKYLDQLMKERPGSIFPIYYRARVSEVMGDKVLAEKLYQQALAKGRGAEVISLDYARFLASDDKRPKALELLEQVLKRNPSNAQARRLAGNILLKENKLDEAIKEFEELSKLEDNSTSSRLKIAILKIDSRKYDEAISELNLLLAAEPDNAPARYFLGAAYGGRRDVSKAVQELRKISSGDKKFLESRVLASFLLRQDRRFKEGAEVLEEAIEFSPEHLRQLGYLVSIQREAGLLEKAIETQQGIIELEPGKDKHYFLLGVLADEGKDQELSMEAMEKAIELNPKNAEAMNYLGYSLSVQGARLGYAKELVQGALELDADNAYYIDTLAWIYFKQGENQKALELLNKAVSIVPNDAVILEHQGAVLIELGRFQEAFSILERAEVLSDASEDKEVGPRVRKMLEGLEGKLGE